MPIVYGVWNKRKGHVKEALCLHEAKPPSVPRASPQRQPAAWLWLSPLWCSLSLHPLPPSLSFSLLPLEVFSAGSLPTRAEAFLSDWEKSTLAQHNPALHAHAHREDTAQPVVGDHDVTVASTMHLRLVKSQEISLSRAPVSYSVINSHCVAIPITFYLFCSSDRHILAKSSFIKIFSFGSTK